MEYRCEATSVAGFIQQLAVAYITHGYWFYVAGEIPEGKDPAAVDAKLIERYGIAISKWSRCRRKKRGLANMQYLRHERFFLLLATKGRHEFFERERLIIRDVRRAPIKRWGYSIGCRKGRDGRWHASVRMERKKFDGLKSIVSDSAVWFRGRALARELADWDHLRFAPVRRQLHEVWRAANRKRRAAGLKAIPVEVVPWKRRIVQPFGTEES